MEEIIKSSLVERLTAALLDGIEHMQGHGVHPDSIEDFAALAESLIEEFDIKE